MLCKLSHLLNYNVIQTINILKLSYLDQIHCGRYILCKYSLIPTVSLMFAKRFLNLFLSFMDREGGHVEFAFLTLSIKSLCFSKSPSCILFIRAVRRENEFILFSFSVCDISVENVKHLLFYLHITRKIYYLNFIVYTPAIIIINYSCFTWEI